MTTDPHDLARFVSAQDDGGTYDRALAELRRGHKVSHWMWFVFPQVAGLGLSAMSQRYAISGLEDARAYVEHPVLGPRLRACCEALLIHTDRSADAVLGPVDGQKLQSSMTLFAQAEPAEPLFTTVLDRFFGGRQDQASLDRLGGDDAS